MKRQKSDQCSVCGACDWYEFRGSGTRVRLVLACRPCRTKRWHKRDTLVKLLTDAKSRAMQKGIKFDIVREDLAVPKWCPVLGIPLAHSAGRCAPGSPSLDRVDPRKGYVRGNVRVISHRANTIKSDATAEEIEAVARYVRQAGREMQAI